MPAGTDWQAGHVGTLVELLRCFYETLWKAKLFTVLNRPHHFWENRVWRLTICGKWPHLIKAWKLWKIHFPKAYFIDSQSFEVKWSEVAQSCPTLWDPIDCSLPGSSVHGIFQVILEWLAISFSRDSSQLRAQTRVSRILDRHFPFYPKGREKWDVPCWKGFLSNSIYLFSMNNFEFLQLQQSLKSPISIV